MKARTGRASPGLARYQTPSAGEPMDAAARRADATENRARIIRAARSAMAESDDVKLNAIAKQAGVGQGTLYRHFPTRDDLLAEVYRADVEQLVAAAPA